MKSISNQYKLLKEGKMSQYNFMRSVRAAFPQYITNVTPFEDAVRILKKKSLLSENIVKQLEKGIEVEKEHTKDEIKAAKIALDHLKEDPKYYTKLTKAGLEESHEGNTMWVEALVDALKEKGINIPEGFQLEDYDGMTPQQAADQIENELMDGDDAETLAMINKIAAEKAGEEAIKAQYDLNEVKSWTNADGKDMYAQFKEIDNLNGQEILIGIDQELENNPELSKVEAAKIVIKNLKKNPNYYTDFFLAGNKEMNEIPTIGKLIPGSDKMKPLKNEADLTDKANGMKPVKGVEKVKASANKASKETNKPEGTISLMSLVAKTSKGVTKMVATGEKMKVVKESKKNLSEVRANDSQLNAVAQQVKNYIDSNPRLKQESDLFAVQNWDDKALLRYDYWNRMSPELFQKLALQFNIEVESEQDEDTGENIFYILTPKFKSSNQTGVASFLTKEGLLNLVREVLAEMESNQQETDDIALGIDETFDGRDNVTDVAGHQLDENK